MLRNEAARWLARLQSSKTPATEERFRRWYNRSPAHADAFDRISRSYSKAGLLRESVVLDQQPSSAREQHPPTRRVAFAAAASLAIVVCGVAALNSGVTSFGSRNVLMLETRVGEIREVNLSDGSKIILDTGTSLAVGVGRSGRSARLNRGRARFKIAKADAPFVIEVGDATVTSGEGLLDVGRAGNKEHVEVLAGRAQVRGSNRSALTAVPLHGGEIASVGPGKPPSVAEMTVDPNWPSGMLEFDGTPLGEAAARANLYSSRQIIVDPRAAQLRVTGAFRARDTAGLAKALAAAFHLSLLQTAEGNLLLSPTKKK